MTSAHSKAGDLTRAAADELREIEALARLFTTDDSVAFDPVATLQMIGEAAARASKLAFNAADELQKELTT